MFTVREFMGYCCDESFQLVEIWDLDLGDTVFLGEYFDIPNKYENKYVQSWNSRMDGGICFNV